MGDETIRAAGPDDVDDIVALWRELMAFHEMRDAHFATRQDADGSFRARCLEKIVDPAACVLVAWAAAGERADGDRAAVGYLLSEISERPPVFVARRQGTIHDLCVTASARRCGVGRRLVGVAEGWFRARGVLRVELQAATRNEVSPTFWRALGYDPYLTAMAKRLA